MIEHMANERLYELQKRVHPHHEYLGYIIPGIWFIFGVFCVDLYFYDARHIEAALKRCLKLQDYFKPASTSLEFFLAFALFISAVSVIYVIGQLINGTSALIMDRVIVKKLLKYPFGLYRRRCEVDETSVDDVALFRNAVLDSTYLVLCVNLLPFLFFEAALAAFAWRLPELTTWIKSHRWTVTATVLILGYVHLGLPSPTKPARYRTCDDRARGHFKELAAYHAALWLIVPVIMAIGIITTGSVLFIFMYASVNAIIAIADRIFAKRQAPSDFGERFFFYARACFTNPIYLAAKLVDYGDTPSAAVINRLRASLGEDANSKDFFWMTYLTVQIDAPAAGPTTYYFLTVYGMVRNLANATALVLAVSVAAFIFRWPKDHGIAVFVWCTTLGTLMYALFARYLYVYASYFSKYVLRAAAFIRSPHRAPTT